ncbi:MAG: hypothetical protein O3A00_22975, partial [Planctomycetota bacterium]|nr:hypothetical protein [Planctomycetota bacterium]
MSPFMQRALQRRNYFAVAVPAQFEVLERRLLLTTTTVSLSGVNLLVDDTDGATTNDNLTLSSDGTNLTITDTSGNLIALSGVTGTGSGTSTVSVALNHAGWTGGLIVNTQGGNDTVTFGSTFDVGTTRGVVVNAGADTDTVTWSASAQLGSLDLTAETINLTSAAVNTGTGSQTYNGAVNVGGDTTITGGDVSLNGTVDSGVPGSGGAGPITTGLTLSFDAGVDTDGNSVWENTETLATHNLNLGANITRNASPTTSISGIGASYVFPTAGSTNAADFAVGNATIQDIAGDPSDEDVTFEIWFKPDSLTNGDQILFETGGTQFGFSFYILNGDTLRVSVSSNSSADGFGIETPLAGLPSDFIQAIATLTIGPGTDTDTLRLYINGSEVGTSPVTGTNINDWTGTSFPGIGGGDISIGGSGADGVTLPNSSFKGEIAIVRLYNQALSGAEIASNFTAVTGEFDLTINSSGVTDFTGTVGGTTKFSSINVNSTGSAVNVAGAINVGSGGFDIDLPESITVNAPINSNGGPVSLKANNGVTLSAADTDIITGGGTFTVDADSDDNGSGTFSGAGAFSLGIESVVDLRSNAAFHNDGVGDTAAVTIGTEAVTLTTRAIVGGSVVASVGAGLGVGDGTFAAGESWTFDWDKDLNFRGASFDLYGIPHKMKLQSNDWIGLTVTPGNSEVTFNSAGGFLEFSQVPFGVVVYNLQDLTGGADILTVSAGSDLTFSHSGTEHTGSIRTMTWGPGGSIDAGSGGISITAADVVLGPVRGSGPITLLPSQAASTIGIGGGTGTFNVNDGELTKLSNGFSSITIGNAATGTGAVDVDSSTFNDPVTIVGGSIAVEGLNAGTNAVTLTARAGAITDGGGTTDVTASSLAASATTGIGSGDALETAVSNLEASGGSGGINIANTGSVTVGGASASLTGLSATNSAISLSSTGTITTSEAIASGSGNIALTADTMTLGANVSGTGTLTIAPLTATTSIGLGGGTGDLNLSDAELAFLQDGFSAITFGGGTGTVTIQSATFLDPVTLSGGTIQNLGIASTIAPAVTLDGTTEPGGSAGTSRFPIDGNVTFGSGETFQVELGGATATTQYDLVGVVGDNHTITLTDAKLNVLLINSFVPAVGSGTVFTIVDAFNNNSTRIGVFKNAAGTADLTDGSEFTVGSTEFRINYLANGDVTLTEAGNTAPVVDLDGAGGTADFTAAFVENGAAVNITDTDATITDAENTTLTNLKLVVSANPDGAAESLTVGSVNVPLNADKTANTGTIGGTVFQVAYVAGTRTLTATVFSGTGAIADFQTLLRGITYNNTDDTPTTTSRTVTVTANDGVVDSAAAVSTITVAATNDAPTATNLSAAQTYTEDTVLNLTDIVVTDVDSATVT